MRHRCENIVISGRFSPLEVDELLIEIVHSANYNRIRRVCVENVDFSVNSQLFLLFYGKSVEEIEIRNCRGFERDEFALLVAVLMKEERVKRLCVKGSRMLSSVNRISQLVQLERLEILEFNGRVPVKEIREGRSRVLKLKTQTGDYYDFFDLSCLLQCLTGKQYWIVDMSECRFVSLDCVVYFVSELSKSQFVLVMLDCGCWDFRVTEADLKKLSTALGKMHLKSFACDIANKLDNECKAILSKLESDLKEACTYSKCEVVTAKGSKENDCDIVLASGKFTVRQEKSMLAFWSGALDEVVEYQNISLLNCTDANALTLVVTGHSAVCSVSIHKPLDELIPALFSFLYRWNSKRTLALFESLVESIEQLARKGPVGLKPEIDVLDYENESAGWDMKDSVDDYNAALSQQNEKLKTLVAFINSILDDHL